MHAPSLDHLVVVSPTLDEGVRWCEQHLGVAPGPGGAHPLMGTHNRLLKIASSSFPGAYLEVIALDPAATPTRAPGLRRWFDMDDERLMARVRSEGPLLAHWVARTPDVQQAAHHLRSVNLDPGPVLQASRETPAGLLQWSITVRGDGQRLFDGVLPTLIEWGERHPTERMPDSDVRLERLSLKHPQPDALRAGLRAAGLLETACFQIEAGTPGMVATFQVHGVTRHLSSSLPLMSST